MKFLILFLISFNLFAGTMPNDEYILGNGANANQKGFKFDTGDGAINVELKVDDSRALIFSGNKYQIGDGSSAANKEFIFDPTSSTSLKWNGSDNYVELRSENIRIGKDANNDIKLEFGKGGSNPFLGYDSVKGKLIFSNDGIAEKVIGSGSGSGGGENFNNGFTADDNANAEDGTTGWTASGGTFAVTTLDPLEGEQSFTWTPAAQNNTLDSPVLDFDRDIFLGRSCQANIEYIGGNDNLTLQVINADNDVLGSQVLPSHSITAIESVFFLCPSSTATANQKDLRLRLINAGATASALIKFDKSYVGTLIGLTETTTPDSFGAIINGSAGIKVVSYGGEGLTTSRTATGNYVLNYSSLGLTSRPVCSVSCGGSDRNGETIATSLVAVSILCERKPDGADLDSDAYITCHKTGADAKQSVQVYKSIPKVSENVNEFSAQISIAEVVSNENVPWIVSVTENSVGVDTVDVSGLSLSSILNCTAISTQGTTPYIGEIRNQTPSSFQVVFRSTGGSGTEVPYILKCDKGPDDYKTPTVQPIIVGQVANSYAESASKNVRVESCKINNNGTATIENTKFCNGWIDSVTRTGAGSVTSNVIGGIFSETPICFCSADNDPGAFMARCSASSSTSIGSVTVNSSQTGTDFDFQITCIGEK